jgi:hypothetical protein
MKPKYSAKAESFEQQDADGSGREQDDQGEQDGGYVHGSGL